MKNHKFMRSFCWIDCDSASTLLGGKYLFVLHTGWIVLRFLWYIEFHLCVLTHETWPWHLVKLNSFQWCSVIHSDPGGYNGFSGQLLNIYWTTDQCKVFHDDFSIVGATGCYTLKLQPFSKDSFANFVSCKVLIQIQIHSDKTYRSTSTCAIR